MLGSGSSGFNNHRIHIDQTKVKEAISKIYEITKKNEGKQGEEKFKLEYDKKPIKYDYIDPEKITSYDRKELGRGKMRKEESLSSKESIHDY